MPIIDKNANESTIFKEFEQPFFSLDYSTYMYESRHFFALFDMWQALSLIIKFLASLISLGACFILIYLIVRFPKLKSNNNIYLLHYSIWYCIELLLVPFFEIVFQWLFEYRVPFFIVCNIYQLVTCNIFASSIFITMYLFDWYLINIDSSLTRNYELFQKISLTVCYICLFLQLSMSTFGCFTYMVYSEIMPVIYIILLIFNITMKFCIKRRKLNEDSTKPFQITIAVFLCWFPIILTYIIVLLLGFIDFYSHEFYTILQAVYQFCEISTYLSPTIVAYLLYENNRDFRKCFNTISRRFKNSDDDDDDDKTENDGRFTNIQADRVAIL